MDESNYLLDGPMLLLFIGVVWICVRAVAITAINRRTNYDRRETNTKS